MEIQARVPAALCALHNFVQQFNVNAFNDPEFDWDYVWFNENEEPALDAEEIVPQVQDEVGRAGERRDRIAQAMWTDYLAELARRGRGPPT